MVAGSGEHGRLTGLRSRTIQFPLGRFVLFLLPEAKHVFWATSSYFFKTVASLIIKWLWVASEIIWRRFLKIVLPVPSLVVPGTSSPPLPLAALKCTIFFCYIKNSKLTCWHKHRPHTEWVVGAEILSCKISLTKPLFYKNSFLFSWCSDFSGVCRRSYLLWTFP